MHICHVCRDTETNDQIKAGCGHLVYICPDCREEQNAVAHQKCLPCRGHMTPDQELEGVERAQASFIDDLFFDDIDPPFEEEYEEPYEDPYPEPFDY